MYNLDTNILGLLNKPDSEEKVKELLSDWTSQLADRTIRFRKDQSPRSFKDLLYKFFYEKIPTYEGRSKQCDQGRRRSLIDFFMLQKHYLVKPLSIEECYDIYFNRLNRSVDDYAKRLKTMAYGDIYIQNSIMRELTHYYCPTVKRNVFIKHVPYEPIFYDENYRRIIKEDTRTIDQKYKDDKLDQFDKYDAKITSDRRKVSEVISDTIEITKEKIGKINIKMATRLPMFSNNT